MPPSPSSPHKRKASTLDLGHSSLSRSVKAQRIHYGIDIHSLLQEAQAEEEISRIAHLSSKTIVANLPTPPAEVTSKPALLWTEKYRAKKFTDLIGDERTHRAVMHWLKRWDKIVFPHSTQARARKGQLDAFETPHKKILLLTGPAGLGKTTLAHVCAKQAGYDAQEINASDERSRDVVKGRIRDMVGTENVKCIDNTKARSARPVCVIVDEVDGVVAGSGSGGEGGFIKALIDLIHLDQRNSNGLTSLSQAPNRRKGDRFKLMRPMILICNDVYHPALRPLRQSNLAEVINMRKPDLATISTRMHGIFAKEGISADTDGVRRLCEAVWGVSNRKEDRSSAGAGEGDMRSVMVVGEWVASKLRAMQDQGGQAQLTRKFIEDHVLADLTHGGSSARGMGRGATKDIVERIFAEGAGFPKSSVQLGNATTSISTVKGVSESLKRVASDRLRQLIDTSGDTDRLLTDVWAAYPTHPFQDDTLMSKPNAAYDWLHFHDCLSRAVFTSNEWELAPYLSTPVVGFHHLFASQTRAWATKEAESDVHPFYSRTAAWAASEAQKSNETILQSLQGSFSLPLTRLFPAPSDIATEVLPYVLRMVTPSVNPVVISGTAKDKAMVSVRKASEQTLVARAVNTMAATGVRFERVKIASEDSSASTSFIFRMEPALDTLAKFETGPQGFGDATTTKIRFAVRQVLDQEFRKDELERAEVARLARYNAGMTGEPVDLASLDTGRHKDSEPTKKVKIVRDFFGRPVATDAARPATKATSERSRRADNDKDRVWITYHEGFSNAVRKPLTLADLLKDM
ncbi:hypothetical protein AMS68_006767 [Peltaster fructicola]|uniref:AAA+ ATPase domain-containing protein n=1 Tax=Peltaster fructicola TaxID=286661 RepID=A0A6H0Y3P4_9PEZI|nr:hypothetical protein AMS68_006767 [Peltaster fructicola]